jgi:hypothetical protein
VSKGVVARHVQDLRARCSRDRLAAKPRHRVAPTKAGITPVLQRRVDPVLAANPRDHGAAGAAPSTIGLSPILAQVEVQRFLARTRGGTGLDRIPAFADLTPSHGERVRVTQSSRLELAPRDRAIT